MYNHAIDEVYQYDQANTVFILSNVIRTNYSEINHIVNYHQMSTSHHANHHSVTINIKILFYNTST